MVTFEISSQTNNIPSYHVTLYHPEFLIGFSSGHQLKLGDKKDHSSLRATVTSKGIFLELLKSSHFFINGKKVEKNRLAFVGDTITLDDTSFKIVEFDFQKIAKVLNIQELRERFINDHEDLAPILNALEKEMIYASDNLANAKRNNHEV